MKRKQQDPVPVNDTSSDAETVALLCRCLHAAAVLFRTTGEHIGLWSMLPAGKGFGAEIGGTKVWGDTLPLLVSRIEVEIKSRIACAEADARHAQDTIAEARAELSPALGSGR